VTTNADVKVEAERAWREIPAPAQNRETVEFWDAAAQGKLLVRHCKACGEPHWYPRTICPFCFSPETYWQESAGRGTIYTFSVMRQNTTHPYAIGYVTLDEGVSLLTNFVDCDFDQLACGQRVTLRWTPTKNGPPAYTFAPEP
jgi:uncharacterized OB-fold protein